MAATTEITCKCGCGRKKLVRTADANRGWGLFFSKSCKAKWQEKRTGATAQYYRNQEAKEEPQPVSMQSGYFGHGQD